MVKGGTTSNVKAKNCYFLLLHLSVLKGAGAANKSTKSIQQLINVVPGIPPNIDGTSLRSGAIQTMATVTNTFHTALKSGHQQDLSRECRVFEYTWCTPSATLVGGMALGGDSNKHQSF